MTIKISNLPLTHTLRTQDLIPIIQNGVVKKFSFNGRIPVTSDLTLYVSPSGNNNNDGLTPSTPFQTIQRAFDIGSTLYDLGNNSLIIQLADGTYTGTGGIPFNIPNILSSRSIWPTPLIIRGNMSNPQNVLINRTGAGNSAGIIYVGYGANLLIEGLSIENNSNGAGISCASGFVQFRNIRFGPCNSSHMTLGRAGKIESIGNYEIYGGSFRHILCGYGRQSGCVLQLTTGNCTLTGNPNFTGCFVGVRGNSTAGILLNFIGSATGKRFEVERNGVIDVNGAGLNYLPGNSAGTQETGGIYA